MNIKITLSIFLLGIVTQARAQIYPVTPIMRNGHDTSRINFVMLPDGFTSSEISSFNTNAANMNTAIFSEPPLSNYKNFFNTYAIEVPSTQSGTTHPGTATDVSEPVIPVSSANTAFGSTFDYGGIHRLLVPTDATSIYNILNANKPEWDQAIIVVNSAEYGGSGGAYATGSINIYAYGVIIHELGHSFAQLADEYWYMGYEAPNLTQTADPAIIKWKNWLGTPGIDIYPHGFVPPMSDWYKPSQGCKMQSIHLPFCSVCQEAIIDRIYSLLTPIEKATPDTGLRVNYPASPIDFEIGLIQPDPNTLKVQWLLNSNVINQGTNAIQVSNLQLTKGDNILTAIVTDTTLLSRSYWPLSTGYQFSVSWKLHMDSVTSVKEVIAGKKFFYTVFPIPAKDVVNLSYDNQADITAINCSIYSIDGKMVKEYSNMLQKGEQTLTYDISSLAAGNYIAVFKGDGVLFETKLFKQ